MNSKKNLRAPTYSEVYMYKNLFWVAVFSFVFAPIFGELILRTVYLYVSTDVAYKSLALPVSAAIEIISVTANYIGYAVLAVALTYFGTNAVGVIRLAFISNAIDFVTYLFAYYLYTDEIFDIAIVMLLETAVNTLVMLVIFLAVKKTAQKRDAFMNVPKYHFGAGMLSHIYTKVFMLTAVVFGGVQIAFVLYDMIDAFIDPSLGLPINAKEVIYWVLQYAEVIISAAVGFIIMVAVGLYAQKLKDSGRAKIKSRNQ